MSEFKPGEIVDITIKGARVVDIYRPDDGKGENLRFTYTARDGEQWPSAVWAQAPSVVIKQADPFGWPPRPGDLWRDQRGGVWFAADLVNDGGGPAIYMLASHDDHQVVPDYCSEKYGPLTLVHREDEQDGGAS